VFEWLAKFSTDPDQAERLHYFGTLEGAPDRALYADTESRSITEVGICRRWEYDLLSFQVLGGPCSESRRCSAADRSSGLGEFGTVISKHNEWGTVYVIVRDLSLPPTMLNAT
jgi:hypothetical protein